MKKEIKAILQDLFELDPSLKKQKKEIEKIVQKLLEAKPNLEVSPQFVKNLRSELNLERQHLSKKQTLKTNPDSMFKRIFFPLATGVLTVALVVVIIFATKKSATFEATKEEQPLFANSNKIIAMGPEAFGSLNETVEFDAALGDREAMSSYAANPVPVPAQQGTLEDNAGGGMDATDASESEEAATVEEVATAEEAVSEDKMAPSMIVTPDYRPTIYSYVYKGEPIDLSAATIDVYKRVPQKIASNDLAQTLLNFDFDLMDLANLANLEIQNVTLKQDQRDGLMLDLNFSDSSINIYQNWEEWDYPGKNCKDPECYENTRLKESDVPSDAKLISVANAFLQEHNVNMADYGEPFIQKYWEKEIAMMRAQGSFDPSWVYIPDTISVVYPFLLDGQPTYDQGGYPVGLTVSVNIFNDKASGLSGLRASEFQSSAYDAVTNWQAVVDYLAKGGTPYPMYFDESTEVIKKEIELGAPETILMNQWQFKNEISNEYFTPALKFPIIKPEGETDLIYQDYILVPLAKDLLVQEDMNGRPMPLIEPAVDVPATTPAAEPATVEPSSTTGAESTATEPPPSTTQTPAPETPASPPATTSGTTTPAPSSESPTPTPTPTETPQG